MHDFAEWIQTWLTLPGIILLLILLGAILYSRGYVIGKVVFWTTYLCFWLLSTPFFAQHLIDGLQMQYAPLKISQVDLNSTHNALIVLGSGIQRAPEYESGNTASEKNLSRLHYAAYLYQKTHFPILTSGGNKDNTHATEASVMKQILEKDYVVPVTWTEDKSRNTYEESIYIAQILKNKQVDGLYLITHAWHMPRSMYSFNNVFKPENIPVIPAPMGYIEIKSGHFIHDLFPSMNALNTSIIALHEYSGMFWYYLYYEYNNYVRNNN